MKNLNKTNLLIAMLATFALTACESSDSGNTELDETNVVNPIDDNNEPEPEVDSGYAVFLPFVVDDNSPLSPENTTLSEHEYVNSFGSYDQTINIEHVFDGETVVRPLPEFLGLIGDANIEQALTENLFKGCDDYDYRNFDVYHNNLPFGKRHILECYAENNSITLTIEYKFYETMATPNWYTQLFNNASINTRVPEEILIQYSEDGSDYFNHINSRDWMDRITYNFGESDFREEYKLDSSLWTTRFSYD